MYIDDNAFREWVGHGLAGMEKAAQIREADEARRIAVNSLIPEVIDSLVANDRIRANQVEKCAEYLSDPVATLQLMKKLAAHDNSGESRAHRMGKSVKTAGFNGGSDSDAHYFRTLGLN